MPPPLLGFNNNVRHKGKIFHIQTEDSGVKHPRIVTHLFADGGRIIKTTRTDYAEHIGRDDMAEVVRGMMKEQHKAMFIALRAGELDVLLDPDAAKEPAKVEPRSSRPVSNPNLRKVTPSVAPPGPGGIELDVNSLGQLPEDAPKKSVAKPRSVRPARRARPHSTPAPAEASQAGRYAASRPAAIFGEAPSRDNLFGDSVISEKSLDEVILSYLAEDLEGSGD